ncbi:MAG: biotin/lipoyl-binding protein [Pedobacter sp.]|nr:MAG: biotin/lipoyl-binding protein [Pedobacter sp.]
MFRWGNLIILAILLMIILMSYFIKYPEFVPAQIVVTSQNPPEKIQARTDSKIEKIFIQDNQAVKKGDVLMVLQSTANYNDVLALQKIMEANTNQQLASFPLNQVSEFKLGELQSDYNNFAKALQDENIFTTLKPYDPENLASEQTIASYKSRITSLKQQRSLELAQFDLLKKNYQRSLQLFTQKVISIAEFENEKIKYLQAQQSLQNIKISLSQTQEAIANLNKTKKYLLYSELHN